MPFYEFGDDDMASAAQSCKLFSPKSSSGAERSSFRGISCGICKSWNGSCCGKRALDNTLSVPEPE
ncbi:MAG: hypothetical protein FIA99_16895 [Ruminiclostridium sp.]|nr:hypothetical protein [Ruminiclostridium sp.]